MFKYIEINNKSNILPHSNSTGGLILLSRKAVLENKNENVDECKECKKKKLFEKNHFNLLQPKLKINSPGDVFEKEADEVADKITSMKLPDSNTPGNQKTKPAEILIQRKETSSGSSLYAYSLINDVINSPGKPLDNNTLSFMGPRFGYDFSKVKIHDNSQAAESAKAVGALAYTVGNNIVLNSQHYPLSISKEKLLAHELTHVIQQSQGEHNVLQRYADPLLWCDSLVGLVNYEEEHGRLNTLVEYNSFDNDDLIPLNYNIPSIYGEVDVDWMLRLAFIQYPFIVTSIFTPSMSEGFGNLASRGSYLILKTFWVAVDPRTDDWNWASIVEEGNWNASTVVVNWIHGTNSLRDIFAPALALCENQTSTAERTPTY